MRGKLRSAKFWVCIALVLCLVGMVGASLVQTSGNKVIIKEMSWESPSGHQLSAYLFKPPTASKQTPAPAVVTIEGWYNNKEMQDLYSIELARRGYVVLALDMHSHGNSESLSPEELYDGAVGVDGAVRLLADLPYVDVSRIGVTGHSSGGTACNMAVALDNEREIPLIKSVLQQAGDWQDDTGGDHSGDYGARSVGIIASEYDDFYFGTYDDAGNMLTNPRQFFETEGAKKFLNFNENGFTGEAVSGKYYTKAFDNETSYRVIYRPTMPHAFVPFSISCVDYAIDYFETTLGAPRPLAAGNQIWVWKTFFNAVGLIGFFIFMYSFTLAMLETPLFAVLRSDALVQPRPAADTKGNLWFWGSLILGAIFSGFSFMVCMNTIYSTTTEWFTQTGPLTLGVWAAACGIFALIIMGLFYVTYGKQRGWSAKETGVFISWEKLWKTVLLAVITIVVSFNLVFFAQYFFMTDFRFYVLAVKTFGPDKVVLALKYLPFFLLFYVVNSISVNCFNYNTIGG